MKSEFHYYNPDNEHDLIEILGRLFSQNGIRLKSKIYPNQVDLIYSVRLFLCLICVWADILYAAWMASLDTEHNERLLQQLGDAAYYLMGPKYRHMVSERGP